MFPTFSSPQLFDICGDAFKNGCKKENYGDFVSGFFLAAPEKKSCSSLHHVNLPIKRLQRRTAQGVGLWEKKKKESLIAASNSCSPFFNQPDVPLAPHPLYPDSHVTSRGPANHQPLALSQLCTLVSGVAQNFATSCELIRHIFSGL